MNNIAGVMYQLKQYSQAEKLFTEVRDIYAANPKVTPSRVAANYNNLGGVCYQQGKYEDAALYFDRALTIYRKVLGDRHPMTLNALKNSNICKQKIQTQNQ
jgi:tetratricopeptide (TPR) repeat protein